MPRVGLDMKKGVLTLIYKCKLINCYRELILKCLVKVDLSLWFSNVNLRYVSLRSQHMYISWPCYNRGETIDVKVLRGAQRQEETYSEKADREGNIEEWSRIYQVDKRKKSIPSREQSVQRCRGRAVQWTKCVSYGKWPSVLEAKRKCDGDDAYAKFQISD